MIKKIFSIVFLVLIFQSAVAEVLNKDHARVELIRETELKNGKSTWVGVHFDIDPHWHVYWKNPGDSGARLRFHPEPGKVTQSLWPYPERINVEHLTNYGYSKETVIFFEVSDYDTSKTKIKLEWLICKVECTPNFATVNLNNESVRKAPKLFDTYLKKTPSKYENVHFLKANKDHFSFNISTKDLKKIQNTYIYPEDGERFLTKAPEIHLRKDSLDIQVPKSVNAKDSKRPARFVVVHEFEDNTKKALSVRVDPNRIQLSMFYWALLLAFLGGLLLNLMPCVLPVLFLKGYSFLNASNPSEVKKASLLYTAGVLTTFLVLGGGLTLLRLYGFSLGWGFQLQKPYIVAFLALLFFVMGLSFLGLFGLDSFSLPSAFTHPKIKFLKGEFGTGVLAVIVASPCTAPFMGTALGVTLFLPPYLSLVVFLALGLGLALPVPLMAHWPWFVKRLPRAGEWMNRLKKWMSLPLFITSLWLFWVLSLQVGASQASVSENWHAYNKEEIEKNLSKRPVFIDFTAAWCITCQVNKKTVLNTDEAQRLFKENNVYLVQADWTDHNDAITQALETYGRNSVPLYVYFNTKSDSAKILPEILTLNDIKNLFKKGEKK